MSGIPRPNQPVRGSATGEPIMALLDLLGRRWALRVIWELRTDTVGFRELQLRCGGMSSSVLRDRVRELRAAGIVDVLPGGYVLTDEGRRLLDLFPPVQAWAKRWARRDAANDETAPE